MIVFFVVFYSIFVSTLDSTKHILCGKVSQAADEIKLPVIIWGVSQLRVSTCGGPVFLTLTSREKGGSGVH